MMTEKYEKNNRSHKMRLLFKRLQLVIIVLILLTVVLYRVQKNVTYEERNDALPMLSEEAIAKTDHLKQEASCLLLWQDDYQGKAGLDVMDAVLSQMKVPHINYEASIGAEYSFANYDTIVISISDLSILGESLLDILDWTKAGGRLMFMYMPGKNGYFDMVSSEFGIQGMSADAKVVEGLHFTRPFMIGGSGNDFMLVDTYESSAQVLLDDSCEVYMESIGEAKIPLVWRRSMGDGCVVVSNLGFLEKIYRGFYCAAYSLLGEGFAYPVINGSAFFLDNFPSPIPESNDYPVTEEYGLSARDFITQVWWSDLEGLAEKYGIRYTGAVLESFTDEVEPPFSVNGDVTRFRYFGNLILNRGGQLGLCGYNHMPLVLTNFDYRGNSGNYVMWKSEEDMQESMDELLRFCSDLYPDEEFQLYVPPTNILSEEAREMIVSKYPQIRVIAGSYVGDATAYVQEFEVADDGIVEEPRIISGYVINDYTQISALMELTFHYVNTHFQEPYDALDTDSEAGENWEKMIGNLDDYMDWLYTSAPDIRNLTGSELAGAIQRYDALEVNQSLSQGTMTIELGGLVDEAWLMVRLNEGHTPDEVSGGTLKEVEQGFYLLKAESPKIVITLN